MSRTMHTQWREGEGFRGIKFPLGILFIDAVTCAYINYIKGKSLKISKFFMFSSKIIKSIWNIYCCIFWHILKPHEYFKWFEYIYRKKLQKTIKIKRLTCFCHDYLVNFFSVSWVFTRKLRKISIIIKKKSIENYHLHFFPKGFSATLTTVTIDHWILFKISSHIFR